ncbi:MAG: alpha/beta hydrolase [Bacteroidetes bacterium]|nr:alpha/beta hydrolase [Bacteroidota bacterium]
MNASNRNEFKEYLLLGMLCIFLVNFVFGVNNDELVMENTECKLLVVTNRVLESSYPIASFVNEVEDKDILRFFDACNTDQSSIRINEIALNAFKSEILSKQGNWLVFVHGDAKTFDEAVLSGCEIRSIYNVNVVVFAWPSKDKIINGYKNFSTSKKNVEKSIYHFNSLICFLKQLREENTEFFENNGLSLFLHSLGNLYLQKMVELNMMPESPSLILIILLLMPLQ